MTTTHSLPLMSLALLLGLSTWAVAQPPDQDAARHRIRVAAPQPNAPPVLGFGGRMVCNGIRIQRVDYDSHAFAIGLERGDVLTHINGLKITCPQVYQDAMLDAVRRDGRVKLRIENIRWHTGESTERFVYRRVNLLEPCLPPPAGDIDG